MSALFEFVENVVVVRAEKQVVGVDALRVIARVANAHSGGYLTKIKLIAKTVSKLLLAVSPKMPVAGAVSSSAPVQASGLWVALAFRGELSK